MNSISVLYRSRVRSLVGNGDAIFTITYNPGQKCWDTLGKVLQNPASPLSMLFLFFNSRIFCGIIENTFL